MKLRHNILFQFLAFQQNISLTTMTELFWNTIYLLHSAIGFLVKPTDWECLGYIAPMHFKNTFPKLNCIIDCFEIFIDQPKNLKAQAQT